MSIYTFTYKIKNIVSGTCLLNVKYTPTDEQLSSINVRVPLPEDYEELGIEHYIKAAAPIQSWVAEEESLPRQEELAKHLGKSGYLSREHTLPEQAQATGPNHLAINQFQLEARTLGKGSK